MLASVIDIDDTLVDTHRKRWAAWRHVLGRELPFEIVEKHESKDVLRMHASSDRDIWERYWRIMLCWEDEGKKLLNLETPMPYAADVVTRWSREHKVIYFTGRSINMYDLTLEKLGNFGFPVDDVDLVMSSLNDWNLFLNSKASNLQLRSRLFSSVRARYKITKVVDDIPSFFTIYKKFEVPQRIAIQRSKIYSHKEYFLHGATKVVKNWKQLL